MHSYAYAFDGLPAFLDTGEIQADRTLIGAFCGQGRAQPLTVEAASGLLVLYYEANSSEASGFNATFAVHRCWPGCRPTQECRDGRCVCRGLCWAPLPAAGLPRELLCPRWPGVCNMGEFTVGLESTAGPRICAEACGGRR
nr:multiple epidermal growth factor-like domains protein 8 [Caretta caretta]